MKNLGESGSQVVFPKVLKCLNCGCEVAVESYEDMSANLPGFSWLPSPPNPPGAFQFGCPNLCGACYVSACAECRMEFHHARHVHFGVDDIAHARFGHRGLTEVKDTSPQKKYRFTHKEKRQPKRRKGDSDGTVSSS